MPQDLRPPAAPPTEHPDDKPGLLQKIINLLLFAMILLHPTQVTLKHGLMWLSQYVPQLADLAQKVPALNFTAADVIILAIVPIWCIKCLFSGGLRNIKAIPLPVWLLILMGLVSLLPFLKPDHSTLEFPTEGPEGGLGATELAKRAIVFGKELIQYILYLMVAYLLLASSVQWRRTLTGLVYTFLIAITVVVGYGGLEYWATQDITLPKIKLGAPKAEAAEPAKAPAPVKAPAPAKAPAAAKPESQQPATEAAAAAATTPASQAPDLLTIKKIENPMDVDSTFGFKMIDAGPHKIGTKSNRNVLGAFLALTLPIAFALVLFHPNFIVKIWMLAVTLAGLGIMLSGGLLIALVAGLLVVAAMRGPKATLLTVVLLALVFMVGYPRLPRHNQSVILDSLMLKKSKDLYGSLPAPMTNKDIPEESQWQQKYTEWQAALNAISLNPKVGVGLGKYQDNINIYYDADLDEEEDYYTIEKEGGTNYMEPDSNNFYLVSAVEMGLPGLLLVLWVIAAFGRRAGRAFVLKAHPFRKALAAGLCGSIVAFAIGSIFTVMLVRGLAITLVIVFAFIHGVNYKPGPAAAPAGPPAPRPGAASA